MNARPLFPISQTADHGQIPTVAPGLHPAVISYDDASPIPMITVAQSYSLRALPLGLDRPLELRGGDRIGPDGLPSLLPFVWHEELLKYLTAACRARRLADERWFSMEPVMLRCADGIDAVRLSRQIAAAAGLPHVVFDLVDWDGPQNRSGPSALSDLAIPSLPVIAMAASGCANPIVTVLGAEVASEASLAWIASVIDRRIRRSVVDHSLEATLDLSNVTWLFQSRDTARISPLLLDLLNPIALSLPVDPELFFLDVLTEAVTSWEMGDAASELSWTNIRNQMEHQWRRDRSYDGLRRIVEAHLFALQGTPA